MDKYQIIKLDIGGKIFKTTYNTLIKSEYFKMMFDQFGQNFDEPIFIDRSPELFRHVLDYLRDDNYPYPKIYESELKFYLITYTELYSDKCKKCTHNHCQYLLGENNQMKFFCDKKIRIADNFCVEHEDGNKCVRVLESRRHGDCICNDPCDIGFQYCNRHR